MTEELKWRGTMRWQAVPINGHADDAAPYYYDSERPPVEAREYDALRARVAELEAQLAAAAQAFRDSVPWKSIRAEHDLAEVSIVDIQDKWLWEAVERWLAAQAPKESD